MSKPSGTSEKGKRNTLLIWGGLIIALVLLVAGGWYLFTLQPPSIPDAGATVNALARANEATGTNDVATASESPEAEGAPEQDAPGTPSPGFTDDFSDALGLDWTVHYGDAIIDNGRLTSHVGAGLAAGDPSWKNYQIEFDVDTSQNNCRFVDTSNSVGVRVQDFDHAYWFVFNNCETAWSLFAGGDQDGTLNLLPDTTVKTKNAQKHMKIKVDGNKMSAYENGILLSAIIDPQWKTGGIFLQVEAQTYYDNFQVTLLP